MTFTLAEAMKAPGSTNIAPGIVNVFERQIQMFSVLPFLAIDGAAYQYYRHKTVGTPAARPVNTSSKVSMSSEQETVFAPLKPLYGDVDVDNMLVSQATQAVNAQLDAGAIGAIAEWQRQLYYGDSATSAHEVDGLINKVGSAQIVDAGATNGGDALSAQKLDEALMMCLDPTHIVMSQTMLRRLTAFARDNGKHQLMWPLPGVGNQLPTWAGIPILTPKNQDGVDVLGFTEVGSGGSTPTATSIYVVSASLQGWHGVRGAGLPVLRPIGESTEAPRRTFRVDFYHNHVIEKPRSVIRIRGISNAAVAA